MADVLRVVGVGMAAGWVGSFFLGKALGSQLHGVESTDPTAFAAMALVLAAAAVAASWVPARRTTRIR